LKEIVDLSRERGDGSLKARAPSPHGCRASVPEARTLSRPGPARGVAHSQRAPPSEGSRVLRRSSRSRTGCSPGDLWGAATAPAVPCRYQSPHATTETGCGARWWGEREGDGPAPGWPASPDSSRSDWPADPLTRGAYLTHRQRASDENSSGKTNRRR